MWGHVCVYGTGHYALAKVNINAQSVPGLTSQILSVSLHQITFSISLCVLHTESNWLCGMEGVWLARLCFSLEPQCCGILEHQRTLKTILLNVLQSKVCAGDTRISSAHEPSRPHLPSSRRWLTKPWSFEYS